MRVCLHINVTHLYTVPTEVKRGMSPLELKLQMVISSHRCQEPNHYLLEKETVLLTAEPSPAFLTILESKYSISITYKCNNSFQPNEIL